jgi:purine-binding chemotaxis protein CheW
LASTTPTTDARSASPLATEEAAALHTLLVGVGGRAYGIAVRSVREVVLARPATRLPGAPRAVLGLINLRGTLVPVVDLAERLGAAGLNHPASSIVLVEHEGRVVGLAVAEVRDVVVLDGSGMHDNMGEGADAIVLGVAHVGDEMIALLDARAVIDEILNSTGERQ